MSRANLPQWTAASNIKALIFNTFLVCNQIGMFNEWIKRRRLCEMSVWFIIFKLNHWILGMWCRCLLLVSYWFGSFLVSVSSSLPLCARWSSLSVFQPCAPRVLIPLLSYLSELAFKWGPVIRTLGLTWHRWRVRRGLTALSRSNVGQPNKKKGHKKQRKCRVFTDYNWTDRRSESTGSFSSPPEMP